MDSPGAQRDRDSRVYHVGACLLLGTALLLGGLWYVQVATALVYVEDQETQSMRTVRVPAVRGSILDIHGRPLAFDQPTFVVNAYLEELRHHFREEWRSSQPEHDLSSEESARLEIEVRHRVVRRFTQQLGLSQAMNISPADMQNHFVNQRALPLPVVSELSPTNVARFMENNWKVPGLELEVTPQRHYPSVNVAHLVGHLRRDNRSEQDHLNYNYRLPDYAGKLGLEKTFDAFLRGQPGTRAVEVNNRGYRQAESTPVPSQPGSNVVLTLDFEIQKAAMEALENGLGETGIKAGAAVVTEVHSGDVVAMVSAPVFDPNEFTPGISHVLWNQYLTNRPSPLLFRATQERYPPGSIFKIISGLAALENGLDPDEHVQCRGSYQIGRRRIKDTASPGLYDFKRAFKKSSNYYFIHQAVAENHGIEHIIRMARQFHLGERTGLLPEQEVAGQLPSAERIRNRWGDGDTANICIGQGEITVTPLQMALMVSTVANGGTCYYPRLVDRIESPDPNQHQAIRQFPRARVRSKLFVKQENLAVVQEAMYADVAEEEGTGRAAAIEGYDVCGKTGTAEVRGGGKITWFASYAPYQKPRYAVVVMAENGASGGKTCAPIAKEIFEAIKSRDERNDIARN